MTYVLFSFLLMYIARKIGWTFSMHVLYRIREPFGGMLAIGWGGMIALVIEGLILWQSPNIILKIIFGFLMGLYIAMPDYGLFTENSISIEIQKKHKIISLWSILSYVLMLVAVGSIGQGL
jgi:hypothetical protein